MNKFYEEISRIKKAGSADYLSCTYKNKIITVRLIDFEKETIRLVTEGRIKHKDRFFTNFPINDKRTEEWIKEKVIKNPGRIIFLVCDENKKIGQLGIDSYDEKNNSAIIGSFIKYSENELPGVMTHITHVLIKWMFETLHVSKITTETFSNNSSMLNVCLRRGNCFISKVIRVKKIAREEGWEWKETNTADNCGEETNYMLELTMLPDTKSNYELNYKILI